MTQTIDNHDEISQAVDRIDGAVADLKQADGLADARRAALHELLDLEKSIGRIAVRARLATALVEQARLSESSATTIDAIAGNLTDAVGWLRTEQETLAKAYVKALRDPGLRS